MLAVFAEFERMTDRQPDDTARGKLPHCSRVVLANAKLLAAEPKTIATRRAL